MVVEAAGLVGTPHGGAAAFVVEAELAALARVRAVRQVARVDDRHVGVVAAGYEADAVVVGDQVGLPPRIWLAFLYGPKVVMRVKDQKIFNLRVRSGHPGYG